MTVYLLPSVQQFCNFFYSTSIDFFLHFYDVHLFFDGFFLGFLFHDSFPDIDFLGWKAKWMEAMKKLISGMPLGR